MHPLLGSSGENTSPGLLSQSSFTALARLTHSAAEMVPALIIAPPPPVYSSKMCEMPPKPVAGTRAVTSALVHPVVRIVVPVELQQLANPVDALGRNIPRDGDHMQRLHVVARQAIRLG